MVAYKAVQDVILTSSYGVGFPIHMYAITPEDGAQFLSTEDVDAVRDAVYGWLELQRTVLGLLAEAIPEEATLDELAAVGDAEPDVPEAEEGGVEPPAEEPGEPSDENEQA